jgi:hypothetical protein
MMRDARPRRPASRLRDEKGNYALIVKPMSPPSDNRQYTLG